MYYYPKSTVWPLQRVMKKGTVNLFKRLKYELERVWLHFQVFCTCCAVADYTSIDTCHLRGHHGFHQHVFCVCVCGKSWSSVDSRQWNVCHMQTSHGEGWTCKMMGGSRIAHCPALLFVVLAFRFATCCPSYTEAFLAEPRLRSVQGFIWGHVVTRPLTLIYRTEKVFPSLQWLMLHLVAALWLHSGN